MKSNMIVFIVCCSVLIPFLVGLFYMYITDFKELRGEEVTNQNTNRKVKKMMEKRRRSHLKNVETARAKRRGVTAMRTSRQIRRRFR